MSKNSNQSWEPGQTVRAGFLSLKVVTALAAMGDGQPGTYILTNGTKLYAFTPYRGLEAVSDERAAEYCEESRSIALARAASDKAQAARIAANAAVCAKLQAITA